MSRFYTVLGKFFRLGPSLMVSWLLVLAALAAQGLNIDFILFGKLYIFLTTSILLVNGVNMYFDVNEDRWVKNKNPISCGEMTEKTAQVIFFIVFLILIGMAFFWRESRIWILAITIFLALTYVVPPIKLKSKPIVDVLSHGFILWGMPFFAVYFIMGGVLDSFFLFVCSNIIIHSMLVEISQHMRDFKSDKKAGLKTTVIWIGKKRTLIFSVFLLSLSTISMVLGLVLRVINLMDFVAILIPLVLIKKVLANSYDLKSSDLMWWFITYLVFRHVFLP